MGQRGPEKQYDVSMRITITHSMDEFLASMALVMDCSKQEVIRKMIDQAFAWSFAGNAEEK